MPAHLKSAFFFTFFFYVFQTAILSVTLLIACQSLPENILSRSKINDVEANCRHEFDSTARSFQ